MESTSMPPLRRSTSSVVQDTRFFQRSWCLRAGLCAIALLAYANSFDTGPALDVRAVLEQDTRIRQASAENLGLILAKDYWWPASRDRLYRPVTTASFLFNYAILGNGDNLAGYHWVNFLLHACNVCLVFALAGRILNRAGPAFFAAALWAVHPLGTEAVTNIVGRADLMAAMAVVGGLLLYIRTATLRGTRLAAAATGLFAIAAAGMFAKENAAVLPGVMLLWDLTFGAGQSRDRWQRLLPYAAAMAAASLLWWVRERIFSPLPWPVANFLDNPIAGAGFWPGRFTAVKVLGIDLWLLICPWQLSADRSYNQIPLASAGDAAAWLSLIAIAAILGIALWRRRSDRLTFWAAGFLGLTLLPTANLIFPAGSIMAERFLYLPSIGFAIAAAALAYRLPNGKLGTGVLALAVVVFGGRTLARNRDWQDNLALFSHDAGIAPGSFKVHDTLGRSLFERNPRANLDRAIGEAEIACAMLRPLPLALRSDQALNYLGMYRGVKADGLGGASTAEGRRWYESSLAALLEAREVAEAAEAVYERIQLQHGKPLTERVGFQDLYVNLGAALSRLGRREEALEAYRRGRNLNPVSLECYDGMAGVHVAAGNLQAAALAMDEKAQLDGMQPATVNALQQLYSAIPEGACAVSLVRGPPALYAGCPKLRQDMCAAAVDLAQAFVAARRPGQARAFRDAALARYGCPAAIFAGAQGAAPREESKTRGQRCYYFPGASQLQAGQPLSRTIFHLPSGSRRQTELKVPVRLPDGSRTGPEDMARVPESSTSTVSGAQENGACAPSKKAFHRSATCLAPRVTLPLDMNTVSAARNAANAVGLRSARVLAKAISVCRTCSLSSALDSARAGAATNGNAAQSVIPITTLVMKGLYLW